ncbi:hypothetical protein JQC93_17655 [Vibrio sp. 188UL20-2]|uniref:Uncharacterized protein n=2 Tax=Vibrio ulleungensis TaxID=2807619 RepID=A0ABS2HL59_9VIBR|nr:hypothetical protein [Vibrio ulleungensis]
MKFLRILFLLSITIAGSAQAGTLVLPECVPSPKIETEIYFYIDNSVLVEYSAEFVESKIDSWVKYSNLTLKNSCVPMTRRVSKIEYLATVDSTWFQDVELAKNLLNYYSAYEIPEVNSSGIPIFKAVLFANTTDSFKSQWCGEASLSSNYFVIGLDCYDSTMEHEIGHLSGAGHDMKTLLEYNPEFDSDNYLQSRYPAQKSYSFGAVCSGRGTVMSYERDSFPAYSSPDISIDGEACGNLESANNAQVLRDFAKKHAPK